MIKNKETKIVDKKAQPSVDKKTQQKAKVKKENIFKRLGKKIKEVFYHEPLH